MRAIKLLTFNLLSSPTSTLHMDIDTPGEFTLSVTATKMALGRGYEENDVPPIMASLPSCPDWVHKGWHVQFWFT